MRKLNVVAVALVMLAACGGSGNDSKTLSSNRAVAVAAAINRAGIGCADYSPATTPKIFTREHGSCTVGSESIGVHTYESNAKQKSVEDQIEKAGDGVPVIGKGWIVFADTESTAKKVQAAIGGSIR